MCGIDDWVHRPKLVDHGNTLASSIDRKFRNEQASCPVLLSRKRPFSQIKGKELKEPAKVVKGLCLTLTERVDRHAKTRRPLTSERISGTSSRWSRAARQTFLFPPN